MSFSVLITSRVLYYLVAGSSLKFSSLIHFDFRLVHGKRCESSAHGKLILPVTFIKEALFPSVYVYGPFIKDEIDDFESCIFILYSVLLILMSAFLSVIVFEFI